MRSICRSRNISEPKLQGELVAGPNGCRLQVFRTENSLTYLHLMPNASCLTHPAFFLLPSVFGNLQPITCEDLTAPRIFLTAAPKWCLIGAVRYDNHAGNKDEYAAGPIPPDRDLARLCLALWQRGSRILTRQTGFPEKPAIASQSRVFCLGKWLTHEARAG
jgi:hypothetical protein